MVVRRYQQHHLNEALARQLLPDHEALVWEEWMVTVDQVLADGELLDVAQAALGQRWTGSKNRGDLGRRWKWRYECCYSSTSRIGPMRS